MNRIDNLAKARAARTSRGTRMPRLLKPLTSLLTDQKETLQRVSKYAPSQLATFQSAFQGVRGKAIKAKCLECVNFERKMVETCEISGCPLWLYRPYQHQKAKAPAE